MFVAAGSATGSTVAIIDVAADKVSALKVSAGANHVTMDPGGTVVFVSLTGSKEIVAVDTRTGRVVATIKVGYPPHQMVVVPGDEHAAHHL